MTLINVESGERLRLSGNCRAQNHLNGLIISSQSGWTFCPSDSEGVISIDTAAQLCKLGFALREGSGVFENEGLSKAIFDWPHDVELNGLLDRMRNNDLCLDIGCGYGRLLKPISDKGYTVIGVDRSSAAICSINKDGYNSICSPIEDFIYPGATFAFSALNTLRYLDNWFAWKRHFLMMSKSLIPGSRYLINLSIVNKMENISPQKWEYKFENRTMLAKWEPAYIDHVDFRLVEKVTLSDINGEVKNTEYQSQLWLNNNNLEDKIRDAKMFELSRVFDANWQDLGSDIHKLSTLADGTYWFELRRKK